MVLGQSGELVQLPLRSSQPTGSDGSGPRGGGRQVLPSVPSAAGPGWASGPSAGGVGSGVCDALSGTFSPAAVAALPLLPPARPWLDPPLWIKIHWKGSDFFEFFDLRFRFSPSSSRAPISGAERSYAGLLALPFKRLPVPLAASCLAAGLFHQAALLQDHRG
jgi:hypothetical protein